MTYSNIYLNLAQGVSGIPGILHLAQRIPTITQAVPPVRGLSIILRGLIPVFILMWMPQVYLTWHRGYHNHTGSSSSPRPFHYTSGVNPYGHFKYGCPRHILILHLAQRIPQSHGQFLQSEAFPLYFGG